MPSPPPLPAQEAPPSDTLAGVDTLLAPAPAADTVDTSDALTRLSRDVGEAGQLIVEGEWDLVVLQLYQGLAELVVSFIPKVIGALFVFILFYALYRVAGSVLERVLHRSKRVDAGLQNLLIKTYRVVATIFIAIMVLDQFGVNVTALLAGLSIVGIAVGFAARDALENFISGITILLDRPFRIGDNIEIDDVYGSVEEITLRSTRLRTLNNEIMVMPNSQMINQKMVNHTILGVVRVEIPFGIAYKEYPQQARDVVLKLTEGDERLHPDHKPQVVVTALGASSVDMMLRVFLKNPKLEVPVRFEYIEKVREALREADIEIPFPHLQLFIDEAKAFEPSFLLRPTPPALPGPAQPSA